MIDVSLFAAKATALVGWLAHIHFYLHSQKWSAYHCIPWCCLFKATTISGSCKMHAVPFGWCAHLYLHTLSKYISWNARDKKKTSQGLNSLWIISSLYFNLHISVSCVRMRLLIAIVLERQMSTFNNEKWKKKHKTK